MGGMQRQHTPRSGRMAFICSHKDHTVPQRKFIGRDDNWPCCDRGHRMEPQENRPYLGQPIPQRAA